MESTYHRAALTLKLQDRTYLERSKKKNERYSFFIKMLLTDRSP